MCTLLRQYCEAMHEPDRFLIHHGNLSASYRQSAEEAMRDEELALTTVTTATLELGIDIGRLSALSRSMRFTVSSFLQRMGRTGRRDLPPEMHFVIREEQPEPRSMLPETIPWKLLQGIALVQLYLEERWVEPRSSTAFPIACSITQVMATLPPAVNSRPQSSRVVLTLSLLPSRDRRRCAACSITCWRPIRSNKRNAVASSWASRASALLIHSSSTLCSRKTRSTRYAANPRARKIPSSTRRRQASV